MVLLVNQHTVPIFSDIVHAFYDKGEETTLFTGHVEVGGRSLPERTRLKKSIAYNRKSAVTRFCTWLLFSIHYAIYLSTCRRPDFILVTTNPPVAPFVTAFIAGLRKIPFHIVLYDLYPDALFQAGFVKNRNPISKLWAALNPWLFRRAKKIFTLSLSMKEAASKYTGEEKKIRVIFNWADTSYIHPIPKASNPFRSLHGLNNKFIVLYAGNMGLTHDLESLVNAADILREDEKLAVVLIGDGGKRRKLEEMVREKQPGNVLFLPFQDEKDFPFAMASADVGVVTLGTGGEGISVPSKTYVNLAAGACLLTIAPKSSELNRLIEEHDAGVICEPGNPEQIAIAIRTLMNDDQRLEYHKRKALEAAAQFTPENAIQYVNETLDLTPATV
jgi:glycosyltransferase involved in cell wall biosynthesis